MSKRNEEVVLVAFQISTQPPNVGDRGATPRQIAMRTLDRMLPAAGVGVWVTGVGHGQIEEYWFAEDDRVDGSDNDSAVFVTPGNQERAARTLFNFNLTADCNLVTREVRGQFEVDNA